MPRELFKRYMPDPERIRRNKSLRFLGKLIHEPNLWHLNRHSVSRAMGIGLFAAFIPLPLQMLLAAALAIPVRGNLPLSLGLVWLSNPLTIPPMFYGSYKMGSWLLQRPEITLPDHLSVDWITGQVGTLWQPLLLGSLVVGLICAVLGYALTMLYWRWWVARNWQKRQQRRRAGSVLPAPSRRR